MADVSGHIEIPKRALFRAAEVCELLGVQPYVLRSWESEFPQLGIAKTAGGPRVYRQADIEQVVRIRNLLLVEGLTLAGARRRLEEQSQPVAGDAPLDELIGRNARDRLTEVKRGLLAILDLLAARSAGEEVRAAPHAASTPRPIGRGRVQTSRGRSTPSRQRPVPRRKRSA